MHVPLGVRTASWVYSVACCAVMFGQVHAAALLLAGMSGGLFILTCVRTVASNKAFQSGQEVTMTSASATVELTCTALRTTC